MISVRFRSPYAEVEDVWTVARFEGPEEEEMAELLAARLLSRDYEVELGDEE